MRVHPFVINFQFHISVNNCQKWLCPHDAARPFPAFLGKKLPKISLWRVKSDQSWEFLTLWRFLRNRFEYVGFQLKGNCVSHDQHLIDI